MPFQAVPSGALAVVKGRVDGQDVYTTLGFKLKVAGLITYNQLIDLASLVSAFWTSEALLQLPVAYELREIAVQALDVQLGPQAEDGQGAGLTGSLPGPVMPNNVTLAVAFRTGLAGRHNRGRNYWPLLLRAEVENNQVTPAKVAAMAGLYTYLYDTNLSDPLWAWAVISRKVIPPLATGRAVIIVQAKVNDRTIDAQRRRLPGRGQ